MSKPVITDIVSELSAKLDIKDLSIINYLNNAVTYAANIGKNKLSKSEAVVFTSVENTIELALQKNDNEDAQRDRTSTFYALSNVLTVALEKPKAYADIKNKTKAIKTINRAVGDITRNMTKTVSVVICSSNNQRDLAYVASNIDGVMSSLQDSIQRAVVSSETKEKIVDIVNKYSTLTTELETSTNTLKILVNDGLSSGYGARDQLENFTKDIVEENLTLIKEKIIAGVATEEIATELKVHLKTFEFVLKGLSLKNKILLTKKDDILKDLAEGVEIPTIFANLKLHPTFLDETALRTYINQWKKEAKDAAKPAKKVEAPKEKTVAAVVEKTEEVKKPVKAEKEKVEKSDKKEEAKSE